MIEATKTGQNIICMHDIKEGFLYEIVSGPHIGSIVMRPENITYVMEVYRPHGTLSGFRPENQSYKVRLYSGTVTLKNKGEESENW